MDVEVGELEGSDTDGATGEWMSSGGALGIADDGAIGALVDDAKGNTVGDFDGNDEVAMVGS